jgi:tetratricopeptide (TPR) repeat protein
MNAVFSKASSAIAALLLVAAALQAQSPSPSQPQSKPNPPAQAQPGDDLIKQGDVCDVKYQAGEALKYYLPAAKLQPKNAELFVRIARQYRHLMSDATTRDDKLELGGIALDYSLRAAALAPDDSQAQLAPAITWGKMLKYQTNKQQFEESSQIKKAAEKAIKLDPRNDLAWHVLGRWNRVLADVSMPKRMLASLFFGSIASGGKLPTGTNEEAVKCFKEAIKINPNRPMHYIELGRTYAQMKQSAEARFYIEKGLAMANTEKDDPEEKREGRAVLATLH